MFSRCRFLLALVTLYSFAGHASANLVTNGSFESGPEPGLFLRLGIGSTAITGWTVSSGEVDYVGSIWSGSDGPRSVDMNGGVAGGISQSFATTPGVRYFLSFDMAANPDGGPTFRDLRVSAAGQQIDFTFDSTGKSRANLGWEERSWDFLASSSSTTLDFQSLTAGFHGALIDNVVLATVPEASGFLCLSLAGVLVSSRRRV